MDSSTKQEIIQKLRAYPLKKKLIAAKEKQYGSPGASKLGGVSSPQPGDPTASTYARMERDKEYRRARELVEAVEDTLPHLTEREKELIELEFWSNKDLTVHGYMMRLNISSTKTYYEYRSNALWKFGVRMGLVAV